KWRVETLKRARPAVQFFRFQTVPPRSEDLIEAQPEGPVGQQRKQKRAYELGVRQPGAIAGCPPLEGEHVDEYRFGPPEEHVIRGAVFQPKAIGEQRLRHIERE